MPPVFVEKIGLTFDDINLVPQKSDVTPNEVDVSIELFPGFRLKIPILSAAMDKVTEARFAIALAREGGLSVIHRGLPIKEQKKKVEDVKLSQSFVIIRPIILSKKDTIAKAQEKMKRYNISGFPVIEGGKLVGIITKRDIDFVRDGSIEIGSMMKTDVITAPENITMQEAEDKLVTYRIEKLPLVDDQGNLKGLITLKDIRKGIVYPNACKDNQGRLVVGAAVGVTGDYFERAKALVEAGVDVLVVDVSHGHSSNELKAIEKLKTEFSRIPLIAGNIATKEAAKDLAEAGADCIKVGFGPGSICTTRVVTGCGVPQITAIIDCVDGAGRVPVIADGGMRYSGDITKAIAAGARAVMLGSMFAGTEETPGEVVTFEGKPYKYYRGMGSEEAMGLSDENRDRYSQSPISQGIESLVPYKGLLKENLDQYVGGLKAGMGICGARNIKELHEKAVFMQGTYAGLIESHPHDVIQEKDERNYPKGGVR